MRTFFLLLIAFCVVILSLSFGPVDLLTLDPATALEILWDLRLPRVLLAFGVGASLSLSGLLVQSALQNPLADPYLLGVSSGAMLGAVLSIGWFQLPWPATIGLAFAGALSGALLTILMTGPQRWLDPPSLILSGSITSLFLAALAILGITLSRSPDLPGIIFWVGGDLSMAGWGDVSRVGIGLLPSVAAALFFGRELGLLEGGEEEARSLGVSTRKVLLSTLLATALTTGIAVAHAGMIGFVGLLIPHAARRICGLSIRGALPAAVLLGGSLLAAADLVARSLFAGGELPVGVFTALIGAPFLVLLLRKRILL